MDKFVPQPYPKRPQKSDIERHIGDMSEDRVREFRAREEAAQVIARAQQSSKTGGQL